MEVERLQAVLEVSGLGAFQSQLSAAQRASDSTKTALTGYSTATKQATAATYNLGSASTSAARAHEQHSKALGDAEKEARGATASFTGLGRAMMFASNAFLGGALIGGALKSIVDKTRENAQAMAELKIAVKDAGESWSTMGGQIDQTLQKQSNLSKFTKTDLATALDKLVLSTGSVSKAEQELHIATDLARLKNEDLATATQQVAQAGLGHTNVLRGLQIAIPKVTTAEDDLKNTLANLKAAHEQLTPAEQAHAQAMAKQEDQAKTGAAALQKLTQITQGADQAFSKTSAGAFADFQKSLDEIEISVGQVLLPDITKLIDSLSRWLDKMNQTGQAQRDAKEAADALSQAIRTLSGIVHAVDGVTGSFKNTLELLLALKFASTLLSWTGALQKFVGAEALGSAVSQTSSLEANMSKLAKIGTLAIGISLTYQSLGDKGAKGFIEGLVGAGMMGAAFGPEGAALAVTADLTFEIFKKLMSGNTTQQAVGLAKSWSSNIKPGFVTNTDTITAALGLANSDFGPNNPLSEDLQKLLKTVSIEIGKKGMAQITQSEVNAVDAAYKKLARSAGVGGGAAGSSSTMTQDQIYQLLMSKGASQAVAQNLSGIAMAESHGHVTALNAAGHSSSSLGFDPFYGQYSPTGDYSLGLFQENFYRDLGPTRMKRYAGMFGGPTSSVNAYTQWLRQHPDVQAEIAINMEETNGYSPWMGDAYVKAHPGLLGGGAGGSAGGGGGGGGGNPSAYARNHATQKPDQSLAQQIASIRRSTAAAMSSIASSASHGGLDSGIAATLKAQLDKIDSELAGAGKNAIPGIRATLANVKTEIQNGLTQAADDKKVNQLVASINDDLKNKLLDTATGQALKSKLDSYNSELSDGLISKAARKQIEGNIADLKAKLRLDLSLDVEKKELASDVATLNQAITAGLYPPDVVAKAKKLAAQAGQQIAEGTAGGLAASKGTIKTLGQTLPIVSGSALLSSSQQAAVSAAKIAAQADAQLAQVLNGTTGQSFQTVVLTDLTNQATALQDEVDSLKEKLAVTAGKQKAAIKTEITSVTSSLQSVNQQIVGQLQNTVQSLQSNLQTIFSSVQTEMDTALGNLYFQNGLQTPSEALLAQMQQQDQLTSLQQALTNAQTQLATDTAGIGSVFDAATGAITSIPNPATALQLQNDQAAVTAAQRQLDEYNLSIKAAQERTQADKDYATQLASLNQQLANAADAYQNGTGSFQQLQDIASKFGITLNSSTVPDLENLSSASNDLVTAFAALVEWINNMTDSAVPIPGVSTPSTVLGSIPAGATVAQAADASTSFAQFSSWAQANHIPGFKDGGPTGDGGLAILHDDEFVVPKGGALVKGGGSSSSPIVMQFSISALDPKSVDWDSVANEAVDSMYAALLRKKKRNGGSLGLN